MRISFFSIIAICLLPSCAINKGLKTVKYPIDSNGHKLVFKIPKGYIFSHVGWESIDDVYKYEDSSVIYFTNQRGGGVNYDNIKETEKLDTLLYIQLEGKDTLILSGVNKKGLNWKNWSYDRYSIGYMNIKPNKKAEFDSVINSVKIE